MIVKRKLFSLKDDLKENPRETIRKGGHAVVNAIVDNPKDTTAYVVGDLVLPGILAKKAVKHFKGPKGKMIAAGLGVYAMSPVGLTSLAIATKNKIKNKRNVNIEK